MAVEMNSIKNLVIVCNFKKMTVDVMKMTVVNMVSKLQQRFSSGQADILGMAVEMNSIKAF